MSKPYGVAPFFGTYDDSNEPTMTYDPMGAGTSAAAKIQIMSVEFNPDAEIDDLNDGNGNPKGYNVRRRTWTLQVEAVIRADTKANAALALHPPEEFQTIALANFLKASDTLLNGNWVYKTGARLSVSDDGEARMSIPLERKFKGDGTEVTPATLLAAIS